MASYKELVWSLYRNNLLFPQVKMGLENMRALDALFGRPSTAFKTVHVAGTNGKGSVSWKVAKALQARGHRTGLFVSPHLACFRERVQVDGCLIPEEAVERLLPPIIRGARDANIPATFFELVTQLAFCHYADAGVEYVALETGLGGRLDSTNVVTPVASVITTIGLDHVRVLGDTLESIALEKAGIIKPGVPVVVGPRAQPDIMRGVADAHGSPMTLVQETPAGAWDGDYDAENTAIARTVLQTIGEYPGSDGGPETDVGAVDAALATSPPSRFEVARVAVATTDGSGSATGTRHATVVLDGGHNEPAFERLLARLMREFPAADLRFVVGMSSDKAASDFLPRLAASSGTPPDRFHFVSSVHARAAPAATLAATLGGGVPAEQVHPQCAYGESVGRGVRQALAAALRLCGGQQVSACRVGATTCATPGYTLARAVDEAMSPPGAESASAGGGRPEVVVVCGSVYLMMEAREVLGFQEPRDEPDAQPRVA